MRNLWAYCLCVAAVALPAWAQSGVHLTDTDAILDYAFGGTLPTAPNGPTGNVPMNFQLGGAHQAPGTNWLPRGNWFYRFTGDSRERQLTNIGTANLTGTNDVEYVVPQMYTGGAANVLVPGATGHMHFQVNDTGVDRARMTTQFCIENSGNVTLEADLFCVMNIDIMADPLNDTYSPLINTGSALQWSGTDGPGLARFNGPGAVSAGIGTSSTIMSKMLDGLPDNFNSVGGFGPGVDVYTALQFHVIVPPQTTFCVPATLDIEIAPEPTSGALLLAVSLAARRR